MNVAPGAGPAVGAPDDPGARAAALADPEAGLIARRAYIDPEVYELEQERVFARCWLYVAHECQLGEPGDFVTTTMGEDQVIVTRDRTRTIRVLLNSCRHKGMLVCRAEQGRALSHRCSYHGWTYRADGSLAGVPNLADAYHGELDRAALGLVPAAQVDTYKGLVFATFSEDAPPLDEYLGDHRWCLDMLLDVDPDGTELIGQPHKWRVESNWKLPAENFIGDFQHAQASTHVSAMKAQGFFRMVPADSGVQVSTETGHGAFIQVFPDDLEPGRTMLPLSPATREWYRNRTERAIERLGDLRGRRMGPVAGTVFPNFSYLVPVMFPSVRVWHPRGPEAIDIAAWCIVDRSAPDEVKADIATSYLRNFGPGGMFEMDDSENWQLATRANRGWVTRQGQLQVGMGLGHERIDDGVPGLTGDLMSEANSRAFHRRWRALLAAPTWDRVTPPLAPDEAVVHITASSGRGDGHRGS